MRWWPLVAIGCSGGTAPSVNTAPGSQPGAYAAQLHLHGPISEGDTTYRYQIDQARQHAVDVLWWTDHDHMYDRSDWIAAPRWTDGETLVLEPPPPAVKASWWKLLPEGLDADVWVDPTHFDGAPALVMDATSKQSAAIGCAPATRAAVLVWQAQGDQGFNELARPLLAELSLGLSLRPDLGWESGRDRVRIRLQMSRVEDSAERSIWLAEADDDFPVGPLDVVVPVELAAGTWTPVNLDLSAYAREHLPEGLDLALQGFELHLEPDADASVALAGVTLAEGLCCEALRDAQATLFDELDTDAVTNLIGLELSYKSTRHLTAFGAPVFVDYDDLSLHQPTELVQWAHDQGARIALTHVFGPTADAVDPALDAAATVAATCEELDAEALYGADYLEVGYPLRGLDLRSHLEVWDCLTTRGHTQTGLGTSDNHFSRPWSGSVNNFVTWILADDREPPTLLAALSAGRAFFGDPTRVRGAWLDLHSDVGQMGQIAEALPPGPIRVEAEHAGTPDGSVLRWIVDGEAVAVGEPFVDVVPSDWTVVRAELWSSDGHPLLFSNPLFLSTNDLDVPTERAATP